MNSLIANEDTVNNMLILPTITTITGSAWLAKLAEVKKFKLEEICLFLTCLNREQRKEAFRLLQETNIKRIPFVHLRSDMELEELDFLSKHYKTAVFNIHTQREFPLLSDFGPYRKSVCIENTYEPFDEAELQAFGGICLDLSHLENDRILRPDNYRMNVAVLEKNQPKCSHISAIKKETFVDEEGHTRITNHHFDDLSELDYLAKYPLAYFGAVAALELENTIEEQLRAKEYISTLIGKK